MYLVVFVTLAIALLGTYAQVYIKQATSSYGQAAPVVSSFLNWHTTAWSIASYYMNPSLVDANGCLLTQSTEYAAPGLTKCKRGGNDVYVGMSPSPGPLCKGEEDGNPMVTPCYTNLPTAESASTYPYSFYSLSYKVDDTIFVLTYIPKPTDELGIGLLCLPGNARNVGGFTCTKRAQVTYNELYKRLSKTQILSPLSWGVVTNSCGTTPHTPPCLVTRGDNPTVYPVPANFVPVGAIGVIGVAFQCTTC